MAKKKVAILGGGIAGLSAAYQLSRTPALRAQFDVTVYQMGWRLGGKIASGRDASGRNIEHGLHVWFGCYDNAFRMLQEIYVSRPVAARFQKWTDAVKRQPFTPIGVQTAAGWIYWPITWPSNAFTPGQGGLQLTLWEVIQKLTELLRQALLDLGLNFSIPVGAPGPGLAGLAKGLLGAAAGLGLPMGAQAAALLGELSAAQKTFLGIVESANLWAKAFETDPKTGPKHPQAVIELLAHLKNSFNASPAVAALPGATVSIVEQLLDIGEAFIKGVIDDVLIPDQPFEALDAGNLEFRAWLISHGADPQIVAESSIIRALYDTAFQYEEGDPARPSYAAGTAVGVLTRLVATYKGDMLWEIQAGMGEAVIAPLYEALKAAGVQFKFFRKVTSLALSPDQANVETIHLARQADVTAGVYAPTFPQNGFACWGAEPDWGQLTNGAQMQQDGVDFESHWCTVATGAEQLQRGVDFDDVVLAIPLGAYKPLNAEVGMCAELINASQSFADYVNHIPVVPTLSVQLWCDVPTAQLGWVMRKAATVAGPEPLSVWADMTQVLAFETQPHPTQPTSLHYLCGAFPTQLYKEPTTNTNAPVAAKAALRTTVVDWLERSAGAPWPLARDGVSFAWKFLYDPQNRVGPLRLDAQYIRVNVGPGECCVGSPAGSTPFRLGPTGHAFVNLFIAGEAARSGCNTSSVEGSVMTGMAAARAITGQPMDIVGYDFLTLSPSQLLI